MADIFRVPKVDNYSVISNIHFKDRRLSLRAKGLLSLILSLPDNWDLTLKGLVKICTEGRDAVSNAIKELETYGYIKKIQPRDKNGKLQKIVYEIYERPEDPPLPENPEVAETSVEIESLPLPEKPLTVQPVPEKPLTVNPTQLSTKGIKNIMNKEPYQSIQTSQVDSLTMELVESELKQNIEYDILIDRFDSNQIDEIVTLICDTVCCLNPVRRIGKKEYPFRTVADRLMSLEFEHIEFVLDMFKIQSAKTKIKNVRSYLLAMLFNAPTSYENYYTALFEQSSS